MNNYKYALRYNFNEEHRDEGYTKEDADNNGLCDAILGISMLFPSDGSYSQALFGFNGKEKRSLTQDEIFKAWLMLGLSLHDEGELKGWKADLTKHVSEIIRGIFNHNKDCVVNKKA